MALTVMLVLENDQFLSLLPAETRSEIERGSDFENFPQYDTFSQLDQSTEQAHLLMSFTSWLVRTSHSVFKKAILG